MGAAVEEPSLGGRSRVEAGEDRGASGLVAAFALGLLIVLILTLSAGGALGPTDSGLHIGLTR